MYRRLSRHVIVTAAQERAKDVFDLVRVSNRFNAKTHVSYGITLLVV
jgi:hypothetical protein